MCGIAGYIGQSREGQWGETYSILRELYVAMEHRGKDATGFAAMTEPLDNPSRQSVVIGKQPLIASKYVKTDPDWNSLSRHRCSMVIQHVRAATHGSPNNPDNNHPFRSGDGSLSLVHNGIVGNDADLLDQFSLRRRSECDSDVLLQIVEQAKTPAEGLTTCLREVRGSMAVAVLDSSRGVIYLVCNSGRPLWFCRLRDKRRAFFASTCSILLSALDKVLGRDRQWLGSIYPLAHGYVHVATTDGKFVALTTQPARYLDGD